ncbi:hypothetical protein [Brachybacterium sp. NPDC056505]|uniref:hypothetical protein n=1 Tax=Brachybacterium sp. NPDC056505 TaxID=3345843 RepID=UPI00366C751A
MPSDAKSEHLISVEGLPPQRLSLPSTWQRTASFRDQELERPDSQILATFVEDRTLDPAVRSSAVLARVRSLGSADLATWQDAVLARRLDTLPDLQVLEGRAARADGDPRGTWYTALLMTDPSAVTLLVRSWSRIVDGQGVTLTLTTLPTVDSAYSEMLDSIALSWRFEKGGHA